MKKPPRTIVVKTLLSPDEFLEFNNVCCASDMSHSSLIREMVKAFIAWHRNNRPPPGKPEWPKVGHNMAMLAAPRGGFGHPMLRLRL
jgi:hypothetical protein